MKIATKYGEMDDADLVKRASDGNTIEYYLDKELVHRSVVVQLKGVAAVSAMQGFK